MKKKKASRIEDDVDNMLSAFGAEADDSTWLFLPELFFKWTGWMAGLAGLYIVSRLSGSQAVLFAFYIGFISVILYFFSFFGKLIESIKTKTIRGGIAKIAAGALTAFLFLMYFLGCFKVVAVFQAGGFDRNSQSPAPDAKFDIFENLPPARLETSFIFEDLNRIEFGEPVPDAAPNALSEPMEKLINSDTTEGVR